MAQGSGRLIVVAGPIGNLGDLSPRAREALGEADSWVVEDTRVSARLQQELGVRKPMSVLNDHTPAGRLGAWVQSMTEGSTVALLSDAGAPGVSDPGAELVDLTWQAGVEVDAMPGSSAVTTALMLSGFFAQRFAFLGYPPRKPGPSRALLGPFRESTMTLVLFEAAPRVDKLLAACHDALGDRRVALCREMSKLHQQVWRGRLGEPPTERDCPRRGEFTVVVEGLRRQENEE